MPTEISILHAQVQPRHWDSTHFILLLKNLEYRIPIFVYSAEIAQLTLLKSSGIFGCQKICSVFHFDIVIFRRIINNWPELYFILSNLIGNLPHSLQFMTALELICKVHVLLYGKSCGVWTKYLSSSLGVQCLDTSLQSLTFEFRLQQGKEFLVRNHQIWRENKFDNSKFFITFCVEIIYSFEGISEKALING